MEADPFLCCYTEFVYKEPAWVAHLDAHLTADQEVLGLIPSENIFNMEIGHKVFSVVILSFHLIQGNLSVSGQILCTSTS